MNENAESRNLLGEMQWAPTPEEQQQLKRLVPENKLAYNIKEAAAALGVSTWLVRAEIKRGGLHKTLVGGRILISCWELVRYLISGTPMETTTP